MWNDFFQIKRGNNDADISTVSVQSFVNVGTVYASYSPTTSASFEYGGAVQGDVRSYDYTINGTGVGIKIGDILESETITLRILSVNEFTGDYPTIQGTAEKVE